MNVIKLLEPSIHFLAKNSQVCMNRMVISSSGAWRVVVDLEER